MTGGVGFRIEGVWAYVALHDDGDEGICGFRSPNGWMPMIAADGVRLEQLRPIAEAIAAESGKPVRLVFFGQRTDVETLEPKRRLS